MKEPVKKKPKKYGAAKFAKMGAKGKKGAGDMPPGMPSAGGGNLAAMAANIARSQTVKQGALRNAAGPRGK